MKKLQRSSIITIVIFILLLTIPYLFPSLYTLPMKGNIKYGNHQQSLYCEQQRQVKGWNHIKEHNIFSYPCSSIVRESLVHSHDRDGSLISSNLDYSASQIPCPSQQNYSSTERISGCRLEIITLINRCSENLNQLAISAKHLNVKLSVLGYYTPWLGFGRRIRMIREYLATLPKDKVIFLLDGDDTAILPSSATTVQHWIQVFYSHNSPILFAGERYCCSGLEEHDWDHHKPSNSSFMYLNAGTAIGYVWALVELLEEAYEFECMDDQTAFSKLYISNWTGSRGSPMMKIDAYNSLFQILYPTTMKDFDLSLYKSHGVLVNTETKGTPSIFHQNGWKGRPGITWPILSRKIQFVETLQGWNLGPVSHSLYKY